MSNFDFSCLLTYAEQNNIILPENAVSQLEIYAIKLLEWNEKINLTAITEPNEIIIKHFIDSLSVLKYLKPKRNDKIIDIGTGAGFPGMVLKIACPDTEVTLLDGHAKRFLFLEDLEKEIGLFTNKLHMRAEIAGKDPKFRENFDFAVARAVARLPVLSEYCLPFVKKGGKFFAMKGPVAKEEMKDAKAAIEILGGKNATLINEVLPLDNQRVIISIDKTNNTPNKYPRASAQISKKPL